MERVLFDTTVLIGAILKPGINFELLKLARASTLFEPVISEVVVCEFLEHCRKGVGRRTFSEDDIDGFFEAVKPLLSFENIQRVGIGKEMHLHVTDMNVSVQKYLYDMFRCRTGIIKDQLLKDLNNYGMDLSRIDPGDLHVMYAAIQHDCDVIITSNTDDFPKMLGRIEVFRPGLYYELLQNDQK